MPTTKRFFKVGVVLLLCPGAFAIAIDYPISETHVEERGLPESPRGYVPSFVNCPSVRPAVRAPHTLSDGEKEWLQKRRQKTVEPMKDLLTRVNIPGFDADSYIKKHGQGDYKNLPNIGLAFSGGAYRALAVGAGVLAAFDSRTPGSNAPGHLGGLLQSTTYVSGLSGGALMVGSIFVNNFTSVHHILEESGKERGNIWELNRNIIEGPREGIWGIRSIRYLDHMWDQIKGKKEAGWETTLTDYWGRGAAYQQFNSSDAGASITWSSVLDQPGWAEGNLPLPFFISDNRLRNHAVSSKNMTLVEISPFETGSWDPTLFGFIPTKYAGSKFEAGTLASNAKCVVGFDNAGFAVATSSTIFNIIVSALMDQKKEQGLLGALLAPLRALARHVGEKDNDIASWNPNPFYKWNPGQNLNADSNDLPLVDGGVDGQNVPFYSHLQQQRAVDVVFAVDASSDSQNGKGYPNGTALIATYERSKNKALMNGTSFPAVPDAFTFVNLGLNAQPTFFGCDSKNQSAPTPLIVYIPNAPYSFQSGISSTAPSMKNSVRNSIIQNGYEMATMNNGTFEPEWASCVGCAILSRSFERTGTTVPPRCAQCFKKHCWNGTIDTTKHSYDPPLGVVKNAGKDGIKEWNSAAVNGKAVSSMAVVWTVVSVVMMQLVW